MKITNTEVIKTGEQELIDGITADLDWGAIEVLFKKVHGLDIDEDVEYRKGDIVVHNGQIAYQLDFEVKVTLSVLLDREGNYIEVEASQEEGREQGDESDLFLDARFDSEERGEETIETSAEILPPSGDDSPGSDPHPPLNEEASPQERINQSASRAGEMMDGVAG